MSDNSTAPFSGSSSHVPISEIIGDECKLDEFRKVHNNGGGLPDGISGPRIALIVILLLFTSIGALSYLLDVIDNYISRNVFYAICFLAFALTPIGQGILKLITALGLLAILLPIAFGFAYFMVLLVTS